jgi:hypothetical protein
LRSSASTRSQTLADEEGLLAEHELDWTDAAANVTAASVEGAFARVEGRFTRLATRATEM